MRRFSLFAAFCAFLFVPVAAFAFKADPFKGWYEILSETQVNKPIPKQYFLLDVDTLQNIWHKYSKEEFPTDWNDLKDEPSIIAGFTDRDLLLLTLERSTLIGEGFLQIAGNGDTLLELRQRSDGQADLAVRQNQRVSRYLLARPEPVTNQLP